VCKTSALPLELLARVADPGQGVEPRSPRSERGVLPVRRSRSASPLRPSPVPDGRSTQQASATCRALGRVLCHVPPKLNDVFYATRLPFDPGSPTTGCARAQWSPSYVEEFWSPSSRIAFGKEHAKAKANCQRVFPARNAEVFLSQAGPRFDLKLVQAEHHLLGSTLVDRLRTQKRRPCWVALVWLVMRLGI
jgi:hypothetical protein